MAKEQWFTDQVAANDTVCKRITIKKKGSGTNIVSTAKEENSLMLYPNPSDGLVFLRPGMQKQETITISIKDITGRVVWKEEHPSAYYPEGTSLPLNVSSLYSGTYFLEANTPTSRKKTRLAIQNR